MSSSRSIAAARNRRASDAPPTPQPQQTRPNTSINSASSLKPQQQQQKKPPPPPPPTSQSNASFSKISVSDAIGLITLRLGRVEQYIIDTQHETNSNELPANTRLVDNSVLLSVVERLEKLEQYMQSRTIDLETIDLRLSDLESRNEENLEVERVIDVQDGGVDVSE